MQTTQTTQPAQPAQPAQTDVVTPSARRRPDLFAYRAPFVISKLLMNKTVATEREAEALFRELVRYLWLVDSDRTRAYPMFSLRVDEAWHQFVLFTIEYADFCQRFFGRFLHHAPSNAPVAHACREATWDEFADAYSALYGEPPPELWSDASSVCGPRRVIRDREVSVRLSDGKAELVDGDAVLVRVDAWGEPALRFIARHGIFYVRELPGLDLDDRIALCRALVASRTLRVAP
ncbi:glycine-rich domain-containing protein [Sorangium sp. So ce124]|uniref:glycine-rich domain-containing protein n=1 Tax=Sorangium sp. So ce124 TaxID=3133280 RepID=UPI003F5E0C14